LNKTIAEELINRMLEVGTAMNAVAAQIEQVDIDDQKITLRRGIADIMGLLYTDLMLPVIREHPELDPDK
jgi:hypothetical protein